jgi:hypothetical protein
MSNLNIRLEPEDEVRLARLAPANGGRTQLTRRLLREEDERTGPLASYLSDHPGAELGLAVGSGSTADTPERGKETRYIIDLLNLQMPDWLDRQMDATAALFNDGNPGPLIRFSEDVRAVIEQAIVVARKTGARPWEQCRDESAAVFRSRREHPEDWIPIADAARAYKALAEGRLVRANKRTPRPRKKRSRAARSSARSGDSGDDGGGGEPHEPRRGAR